MNDEYLFMVCFLSAVFCVFFVFDKPVIRIVYLMPIELDDSIFNANENDFPQAVLSVRFLFL